MSVAAQTADSAARTVYRTCNSAPRPWTAEFRRRWEPEIRRHVEQPGAAMTSVAACKSKSISAGWVLSRATNVAVRAMSMSRPGQIALQVDGPAWQRQHRQLRKAPRVLPACEKLKAAPRGVQQGPDRSRLRAPTKHRIHVASFHCLRGGHAERSEISVGAAVRSAVRFKQIDRQQACPLPSGRRQCAVLFSLSSVSRPSLPL